ncbi:hypothetical protein COCNU_scaffold003272G000030 [Cocos nucifera]|nr:hypothetical protein [Cocos nucifera]
MERKEEAKKKKKKKLAIAKVRCKTSSKGSNGSDKMGHQLIANIKMMNLLRSKVMKVWEDHQAEVNHLLREKAQVEHLLEKTTIEVKGLQEIVQAVE